MRILTLIVLLCFAFSANAQTKSAKKMKVAVWDTYVTKRDGTVMHFDIITPNHIKDEKTIHTFGKKYLQ